MGNTQFGCCLCYMWCWFGDIWLEVFKKVSFTYFLSPLGWLDHQGVSLSPSSHHKDSLCLFPPSLHHGSGLHESKCRSNWTHKHSITSATFSSSKQAMRLARVKGGINRFYFLIGAAICIIQECKTPFMPIFVNYLL